MSGCLLMHLADCKSHTEQREEEFIDIISYRTHVNKIINEFYKPLVFFLRFHFHREIKN